MWRRRIKDFLEAALILALFASGLWTGRLYERSQWQPVVTGMTQEIDRLAAAVDDQSGQVAEMVLIVTHCESTNRHEGVWGDGERAYGIAQIWEPTFYRLTRLMGRPELQWKNKRDQLIVLSWAVRNGHKNEWTCGRRVADGS